MMRQVQSDPNGTLEKAKRGDVVALNALGNAWLDVPALQSQPARVLDALIPHFAQSKVPKTHSPPSRAPSQDALRALHALVGLGKMGPVLNSPLGPALLPKIVEAGPGLAAWLQWYFDAQVAPADADPMRARAIADVLGAVLYTLANQDALRPAIVRVPGTIEIASVLWMREDGAGALVDLPVGTLALGNLLKSADARVLDRVVAAVAGRPAEFANTALARLKAEMTKNNKHPRLADRLTIYMDFVNSACRVPSHPLRHAFLAGGVIHTICKALNFASNRISPLKDRGYVDACVSGFGFLCNVLHSTDGFTWVKQALQAGVLTSFVDCSPVFSTIDPDDRKWVLDVLRDVLPQYLVYPSVIKLCQRAIPRAEEGARRAKVDASVARDVWADFRRLAIERAFVLDHAKITKVLACDNRKCQRSDHQKQFQACSACLTTYYCSPECQREAWKEGDHKTMCKLKQKEHLEGKDDHASKSDVRFFHHLSIRDARRHLPLLLRLINKDHPSLALQDVVICIDYTRTPAAFTVKPLDGYTGGCAAHRPETEARNAALIAKVRGARGTYKLIESTLAAGRGAQLLMTLASGRLFARDAGNGHNAELELEDEDFEGADELFGGGDTVTDAVDMMMIQDKLRSLMKARPSA